MKDSGGAYEWLAIPGLPDADRWQNISNGIATPNDAEYIWCQGHLKEDNYGVCTLATTAASLQLTVRASPSHVNYVYLYCQFFTGGSPIATSKYIGPGGDLVWTGVGNDNYVLTWSGLNLSEAEVEALTVKFYCEQYFGFEGLITEVEVEVQPIG